MKLWPVNSFTKRLRTEASWVFAGQTIALLGTLVGVRVLTDLLPPEAYGVLGLGMTLSALFTEVVIGGLVHGFTRFYSVASKAQCVDRYLLSVRTLTLAAVSIAILVVLVLTPVVVTFNVVFDWNSLVSVGVFASLFGASAALNAVLNGARNRRVVATSAILDTWLRVGLALVAINWFGATAAVVLYAYSIGLVFVVVRQTWHVRLLARDHSAGAIVDDHKGRNWNRDILIFAWPISLWGIFTWAQQVADRWALEVFRSTSDVGFYSVLLQLGFFPMTIFMGVLGTFLAPIIFEKTKDTAHEMAGEHDRAWRKLLYAMIILSLLGALVALLATEQIFEILVAESYRQVAPLLPLMVLAGGFYGAAALLSMRLMAHMRTAELARIMISSSLIGVALISLLTQQDGLRGTVIGKLLFGLIYLIMMYFATIRYAPKR